MQVQRLLEAWALKQLDLKSDLGSDLSRKTGMYGRYVHETSH